MRRLLGVAVVALAAAALWLTGGDPAPPAPAAVAPVELGPGGCRFAPDATLAYRWASTAEARDPRGGTPPAPDSFSAVLSLRAARAGAEAVTLEAGLTDVVLRQHLAPAAERVEHALSATFAFDVAADCRVTGLRFPEGWSPAARRLVAGMIRNGELVSRPGPSWEVEQRDGIGAYHARYTRDGATLRRRKVFYDPRGLDGLGLQLRLFDAETEATMGPEGPERLRGHERIQMVAGRQVQVDLEQTFTWTRDDARYRRPPAPHGLRDEDAFAAPATARRLPPAPTDLEVATASFRDLARGLSHLTTSEAKALAALVAEHPALLAALERRLEGDSLEDAGRADVFWILELAEARDAILPWLEAPTENDRVRAALALAGAAPTLDTSRRLAQLHREDPDPRVAATGLLALGSLAREGGADVQAFVRTSLTATYEGAHTTQDRVVAIQAMGNSRDPAFLVPLTGDLDHPHPRVRDRAARALAKIGAPSAREKGASRDAGSGPGIARVLKDALVRERDPRAAHGLVASLRDLGPPAAGEVSWIAARLRDAPPRVRAGLIAWLGASAAPEARAALAAHFPVETSSDLRQLIGRYVTAAELGGA